MNTQNENNSTALASTECNDYTRADGKRDIHKWQQDFYNQPKIYWVEEWSRDEMDYLPTGNYYDSEENAMREVRWIKNRGKKARIQYAPIHNTQLTIGRWGIV